MKISLKVKLLHKLYAQRERETDLMMAGEDRSGRRREERRENRLDS